MTADPYSRDELPGVIAELREFADEHWWSEGDIELAKEKLPRLLATVEALAADADTFIGMSAEMIAVGIVSEEWVRGYIGDKLFETVTDAARREGCDGNP